MSKRSHPNKGKKMCSGCRKLYNPNRLTGPDMRCKECKPATQEDIEEKMKAQDPVQYSLDQLLKSQRNLVDAVCLQYFESGGVDKDNTGQWIIYTGLYDG